jgi:hypothetical protein
LAAENTSERIFAPDSLSRPTDILTLFESAASLLSLVVVTIWLPSPKNSVRSKGT